METTNQRAKDTIYIVMVDVHDEHGKRKMQFAKEAYSDKADAMQAASRINGRNLGDRVTFAHVAEAPYFRNDCYDVIIDAD